MSRLPIRAKLTAAFALAMMVVLIGAGLFVYLRLRTNLDETINEGLRARAAAVARHGPSVSGVAEESFSQLLASDGRVRQSAGGERRPALAPRELPRSRSQGVTRERHVPGIEGTARVLSRAATGRRGVAAMVVGQSLQDRNETLSGVVTSFAVGGPIAVLLASIVGYLLATSGLRPVEAIRRQAAEVSLSKDDRELPLPAAHDEVRRLGETLNDMLGRLRRAFERERRFVADASHELRTPVAVVKTELETALRSGDYGPDVRAALVAAVEECDHLAQLAEDLLVVARAADGQLPVRAEELRAHELLAGVRERFADRAVQHARRIRIEAPEDLSLGADPLRLRQALGNLVDNALRHGGGEIVLSARPADGGVELVVADEGAGFPPALRERAFERFARGDGVRTRGGAGLGLAIVQAVAAAHGGTVSIAPGASAAVRLWLPPTRSQGHLSAAS